MHNGIHNNCTTTAQQLHTNNNDKNIILDLINRYKGKTVVSFNEKMRFLNTVKNDPVYQKLTSDGETKLRNYIMGRTK